MPDLPEDNSTGASIHPGETLSGTFDTLGDHDYVRVELEAGKYYAWDLDGPINEHPDRGPLERGFVNIYDTDGQRLTPNWRDVYFAPDQSGTYFLDVWTKFDEGDTGDYTLEMLEPTAVSELVRSVRSFSTVNSPDAISVAFDTSDQSGDWSAVARGAFQDAFEIIEDLIDVDIVVTQDEAASDWLLRVKTSDSRSSNFDFPNFQGATQQVGNFAAWRIDAINSDAAGGREDIDPFQMGHFLHELGHALGLAHTHDRSFGALAFEGIDGSRSLGAFDLNEKIWSIMSYNGREPGNMTFSPIDVAALQDMYGANMATGAGDDVYMLGGYDTVIGFSAIWDAGGTDMIRTAPKTNFDVTIDLRDASLEYEEGGGGWRSQRALEADEDVAPGGFTIPNGVVIENAFSGGGDDRLVGNSAANILHAGGGDDVVHAGDGDDNLVGADGDDMLDGGKGADRMDGGAGDDLYFVDNQLDQVIETITGDGSRDEVRSTVDFDIGASNIEILTAVGSQGIRLDGNELAQTISGGAGNDTIVGVGGDDELSGGGGADFFGFRASDGPMDVVIQDFQSEDQLVLDDQFFDRGRLSQNFRELDKRFLNDVLADGSVSYDAGQGVIRMLNDTVTITLLDGNGGVAGPLVLDDVLLF